ncbi:retrovirus-related pol polyprotein from transposon TNT 1-94, partial [Tanacetum coccineum]
IPPPFGASSGNPGSPNVNRVDTMPKTTDPINTTNTTNLSQSVVDENLPQLLDSRGGPHVINVPAFDKDDFMSWKVSIIISCLPNDVMKSVIKCKTAKEMWNDLILAHEGPSDTRDTKIAALRLKFNAFKSLEGEKVNGTFTRLKCLLNDLENNGVTIPQAEVNATLATLYGKYNYEEGLIDQIYESETQRFTIQASSSKALISNHQFQDRDSDVEEDQRTNNEFMADLNVEYHERALLANQKRFYKRSGRDCPSHKTSTPSYPSSNNSFNKSKPYTPSFNQISSQNSGNYQEDYKGKYKGFKAEMVVLTKRIDDMTKGKSEKGKKEKEKSKKEDEPSVGKAYARLGQWVDITMKKVHRLLSLTDGDERKHVLDYNHVDLHYVEDQRKKLVPGNIIKALGGKGIKKEKISSKEVVFTKADESLSKLTLEITSDSESECDSQEPLPPLPKLIGATPSGTSEKKSPAGPKPCSDKKADSSTEQLLLTLMEETWFGPCKHCGFRNHLSDDCYSNPKCSTCGSTNHLTKEHLEHAAVKKTLSNLKAQSPLKSSPKKTPMITKPFIECKYCGFNDHHSDHCNQNPLKSEFTKGTNLCENVCAGLPQEESGPKVVFGDDSSRDTEGYGSVNYNGITFTRVAYMNGLKHNLISINQLCDANYKVLFTKTQGTIYNQNDKVVLIAPRRRDVYVIDMSSFNKESNACFFVKASPSVNWLWHKRLSHLNFKNINNLAKHNLVSGLPSLTFSKDKNYSACEKRKHHRASFKIKRSFSINKSLHLLHMDLFGPVKPQTISHNKYTLVIVDEYSRKMENLNEVRVKELRSDNGT